MSAGKHIVPSGEDANDSLSQRCDWSAQWALSCLQHQFIQCRILILKLLTYLYLVKKSGFPWHFNKYRNKFHPSRRMAADYEELVPNLLGGGVNVKVRLQAVLLVSAALIGS